MQPRNYARLICQQHFLFNYLYLGIFRQLAVGIQRSSKRQLLARMLGMVFAYIWLPEWLTDWLTISFYALAASNPSNGSLFRACVLLGMLIKRHEMKIIKNMYKKHTSAYVRYVCALYSAHTQKHKRFYRKFSIYGHTRYGCRTGSHWTRLPLKIYSYVYKFHRVYEAGWIR